MRKVTGIGETVYDIVFKEGRPRDAVPGGSTFNSMISLGRCGIPSAFLSEVGRDKVGSIVKEFMTANGVDTEYVKTLDAKTPVSLAFLDENNDATYLFYREPVSRAVPGDLEAPDIREDDIVLFGSFHALNPASRPIVRRFLEFARSRGAIIYYDVNFRPSHIKDLGNIGNALWENLEFADVVRGSREDFQTLFGLDDAAEVFRDKISSRCGNFIRTDGASPLRVMDIHGLDLEFPVKEIRTVSTIGAGDSFNAGFIYGLVRSDMTRERLLSGLDAAEWAGLVALAQEFSASCCASTQNYITPEFAATLKQ